MKTCFFIAPLGDSHSEIRRQTEGIWEYVIRPTCEALNYQPMRADLMGGAGSITQDIISALFESDLVIADITNSNPNVMYELGVRHTLAKPVIVLTSTPRSIPFDIASYRALVYQIATPSDAQKLSQELTDSIRRTESEALSASPVLDSLRVAIRSKKDDAESGTTEKDDQGLLLRTVADRIGSLEQAVKRIIRDMPKPVADTEFTRDVFIVHGHDGEMKNELARFLQKLEFNPIILHEQPDRGQTILQKLQYEGAKVGFAFILHTPDDEGRVKDDDEAPLNPRSRQNVVFEHGMFVGQFSHTRVCAIVRESVEIPTDLSGVVYKRVPADGGINSIAFDLVSELRAAGYVVDANKLLA